ncbi:MAG: late competence development ComFB family protein [Synechococcus sp.]|nr:late competence development ComFB family protein [Synechococcus sp.]
MNQSAAPFPRNGNRRAYQNIMETLVNKEVHRQLKRLPQKLAEYIDVVEVATYALNRLPPLYASSERGKERQEKKGNAELKQQVTTAVRQAIAAVQRDPIRSSNPLPVPKYAQYEIAETCLRDLEKLLRDSYLIESDAPAMDWDTLKLIVAKALKKSAMQGMVHRHIEEVILEWEHRNYVPPVFDWQDSHYKF